MTTTAVRPGADARELLAERAELAQAAAAVLHEEARLRDGVVALVDGYRDGRVRAELGGIEVGRLRETTERNLRLQALEDAGVRTVRDVLDAGAEQLEALDGVGPHTARAAAAAAHRLAETFRAGVPVRIEPRSDGPLGLGLASLLYRLDRLSGPLGAHRDELADVATTVAGQVRQAAPARSRLGLLLRLPSTRERAREALEALARWEPWLTATGLPRTVRELTALLAEPGPLTVWEHLEQHTARYYALLDELVPGLGGTAAQGTLPAELVERISAFPLDESPLRARLRGYQVFGAKFALNQGRALIGDEMGLGKTVQAIAVMAHLAATGEDRALVVCPASVVVNWCREVTLHSELRVHRVHGPGREDALAAWHRDGGIAVTTFATLPTIPLPATPAPTPLPPSAELLPPAPALLVVDEAHYAKNPRAQRSQQVAAWAERTPRALFLTGTALLNRVEELLSLARLLQPEVVAAIPPHLGLAGADTFRRHLAPVYLRRNLDDVLVELPPRMVVDEWETMTPTAERRYRAAVAAGNLMAMRRADLTVPDPADSAKLERLLEIVAEARDGGQRVVVFSYFLDVVARVAEQVERLGGVQAFGPITGSVPAAERQEIVDAFTVGPPGAVLVSQIGAGGVGLNVQAASVVVICEPQLVPAVEDQAIGRVHRMGQQRPVQVHRLLTEDSVDERIEELLAGKRQVFDAYAGESSLAQEALGAVDVTEAELATRVVAAEQARLGYGPVWDELEGV
ncbi:Helicase conserved C-terminal domain-containing protein [Georgenia satyanarayanai]|uniref:Helicase conserved C-terminal domain-containing protein n=1 Tax=Georgenia satyanarayanai TaxID=860221 RepID=A0A2Y9C2P2_9MICO|nr:DEAD/DEAH box helicase [Georgenia satyanarayanai]PYG01623.1 helicase-like protein [Georgenia satyanarayanai]SSA36423.1 Helicase conserved C-terminal domain-containing protein [Georgenia satyanarayanai]